MSEIFNMKKLYRAYYDCRKNKRNTASAIKFELDLENNIAALLRELSDGSYKPGRSICFVVANPTVREIFAADFRDRVIHHLLINEIIEMGERRFINCSFACRVGKGTHKAVARIKSFLRKASGNGRKEIFYAQLDISGFFMKINHEILYGILERIISRQKRSERWKEEILWLARVIIFQKPTENYVTKGKPALLKKVPPRKSLFHSPPNCGLPIGNYTSQFFANLYMNELDQFVKRNLKVKYYVRYVDDLVILGESRDELKSIKNNIARFLDEKLGLSLSEKKIKIQNVRHGLDFLGYFIKPAGTMVRRRVVKVFKNKLFALNNLKIFEIEKRKPNLLSMLNSYFGHFRHARSFRLKEAIFASHFGKLRYYFQLSEDKLMAEIKE